VLCPGVLYASRSQIAAACPGVPLPVLKLLRPHSVLMAGNMFYRLSRFTSPGAELISIGGIDGLMDASRRLRRIEPVATGVVENYVQDDAHAPLMSISHQHCQIFPAAESRIDIQKVLHPIAMIAALVGSLAEDGAQPQCSDPQALQISQL